MAPPGMPKTFSAPAASSEAIRLCAPVTTGPLPEAPELSVIACLLVPDGSSPPLSRKSATASHMVVRASHDLASARPHALARGVLVIVRASFTSRSVTPPASVAGELDVEVRVAQVEVRVVVH